MPSIETSIAVVTLRDDGIFVYRYKPNALVDEVSALDLLTRAEALTDRPRPSLIDISHVRRVTRQARAVFAESEINRRICREAAFVVGSPVSRVIGNFFLGINKPDFPTKLFDSEEQALEWLKTHV